MTRPETRNPAALFALILTATVLLGVLGGNRATASDQPETTGIAPDASLQQTFNSDDPYVAGEILVQKTADSAPVTVRIPEGSDPVEFAKKLQARPGVNAASPNFVARASSLPNDPGIQPWKSGPRGGWTSKQWNFLPCGSFCGQADTGVNQSIGGINVVGAWKNLRKAGHPGAEGVRVAVIDSGIAYRNYKRGYRKSPDIRRNHVGNGYDFVGRDKLPLDSYGHGTHIASTIGQSTNNGVVLTGIAYRAKLLPVRVLNSNGFGTTREITDGVRWAANHHAQVAVMSLNFPCGDKSKILTNALQYAHSRGVVLVASAGNAGATTCPSLPATGPGVIAVGSSTAGACLADYSFESPEITVVAPGGGSGHADCATASKNRPIFQLSMRLQSPTKFAIEKRWVGTSMAAAHVAGAAAMVIASGVLVNSHSPKQVRDRLVGTTRTPAYAEGDPGSGFGAGIIDAGRATDPNVTVGS